MLLALLSDIHANLPALEAVLRDARRDRPDAFLVAGDLSGGPYPNETLDLLRSLPGWTIRGNGEGYLLRFWQGDAPLAWQVQRQFGFMRWCANHVAAEHRSFVMGLAEEVSIALPGLSAIRLVHGSPGRPSGGLHPENEGEIEQALALIREPVLVCGHTHAQWQMRLDGRLAVNAGAVCAPCDGTTAAQYVLLRWDGDRWQAQLRQVGYNIAAVRRAFQTSGLLEEGGPFARAVLLGIETGIDVARPLLQHANRFKEAQGLASEEIMSDEIWEAAAGCFDWQRYERGGQ